MNLLPICGLLAFMLCGSASAANCTVSAVETPFGGIAQLNPTPVDVQGTISVQCQAEAADLGGTPAAASISYTISLSAGSSGAPLARAMQQAGGAENLPYNVYIDPGHQTIWGDGNGGTAINGGQFGYSQAEVDQGQRKSASYLSYSRVPANINILPGEYTDVLTVRLSF